MKKSWVGTHLAIISASLVGSLLFMSKPATAYCVYNDSNTIITVLQMPLSPRSFKAVLQPHAKSCCPWNETTCLATPGRYGKTPFALYRGAIDTNALTADRVLRDINGGLASLLDVALKREGIPPLASSMVKGMYQALDRYLPLNNALGIVETYNGGIVQYNGGPPLGCWTGPCREQDVNADGSTGYKR